MRPSWLFHSVASNLFDSATTIARDNQNAQSVYPRVTVSQNASSTMSNSSQSSTSSSSPVSTTNSSSSSSSSSPTDSTTSSTSNTPSVTSTSTSTPSSSSSSTAQSSPPAVPSTPPTTSSTSTSTSTSTFSSSSITPSSVPSPTPTNRPSFTSSSTVLPPNSASNSANVTVTVLVSSNPTIFGSSPEDTSTNGFFSHTGGVAGTFLVIGLFSTSIFLYFFFWIKRKIRRNRITRRVYMQDDYRSLSRSLDRQQATPEPRPSRDSTSIKRLNPTPPPPSIRSRNNSIGHIPFPSMDHSPYQAEPGEFDPYKPEAVTKVYSDDYAQASEYEKYLRASTS